VSDCENNSQKDKFTYPSNFRNVLEDYHVPAKKRYYNSLVEDSAQNRFYLYDACGVFVELASGSGGGSVSSVNGKSGTVILVTDDISDVISTRKYTTAADITKLAGIQAGAQVNAITSVNGKYDIVVIDSDDISDTGKVHKFVTAADITKLSNLSGVNTGDQNLSGLVPTTRTINSKALTANVILNQDDVVDGTTYKQYSDTEKSKLAGIASGATANSSDATLLDRANHTGAQSADTLTDGTTNKAFLATERTKLTGIATGATLNDTDANLKNRANHTGVQLAATISDLDVAGWVAVPATATSTGVAGQRAYEPGFLYICVNTNTWERVATATW